AGALGLPVAVPAVRATGWRKGGPRAGEAAGAAGLGGGAGAASAGVSLPSLAVVAGASVGATGGNKVLKASLSAASPNFTLGLLSWVALTLKSSLLPLSTALISLISSS